MSRLSSCFTANVAAAESRINTYFKLFYIFYSNFVSSVSFSTSLAYGYHRNDSIECRLTVLLFHIGNRMTTQQQQRHQQHPVIELSISNVCLRHLNTEAVHSLMAKVSAIEIFLHGVG